VATTPDGYFPAQAGRIKIQIESLIGSTSKDGWIFQGVNEGNNPNAQGTGYFYFRNETKEVSPKLPQNGIFAATIWIEEAGYYDLRLRTARDTNDPPDARNDIWVKVDEDTRDHLPPGTVPLTAAGGGFVKLKGASKNWGYATTFSPVADEDANVPSRVWLGPGFHTITFAARSVGLHIDFFEVVRQGLTVPATASGTGFVPTPVLPDAATVAEDGSLLLDVLGTSGLTLAGVSDPAHGTATLGAGGIAYLPDANFFGTDSFAFTVTDARGAATTHAVTVTVTAQPDAPFATADTGSTFAGQPVALAVLGNDGDADGTPVALNSFDAVTAQGGSVALVGGVLTYTPAAGFIGTDSFGYDAVDPTGLVSGRATVTVTVAPVPDLPVVVGLYDGATDHLVDLLSPGAVIDHTLLGDAMTFSVAVPDGSPLAGLVGSMKLKLSGAAGAARTESSAPYALFGDADGDLNGGMALPGGTYRFEVDVFSGAGGKGTLLDSLDFDFTVTAPPPPPLPVTIGLYDAATDALIDVITPGEVIDPALLTGAMTIAVGVPAASSLAGRVGSLKLKIAGDASAARTESSAPYALFGDADGDLNGGLNLRAGGAYTFTADAYSGAGAKGTLLDSVEIAFSVADPLLG
jgi:hypothetical protein